MKVAFNARYLYDPGLRGFNRYAFCLLRALEKIPGVEITLLSEERYPVHQVYKSALRAQIRNLSAPKTLLWEQWVLPRYLKRSRPDVFHAPADGGLPLRKQCPYVLTLHGVPVPSLASLVQAGELTGTASSYLDTASNRSSLLATSVDRIRAWLLRHIYLQAADLVITVSEFSKSELVRFLGLRPDRIRVIYEGADETFSQCLPPGYLEEVRAKYGLPSRFLLFVGGFDRRKNVSTLLRAFARITSREPDVALVLVGIGGDIDGCKLEATSLGFPNAGRVFFLHRISDRELAALYRSAMLFVTLSWHEGFCLPVVEAMTAGCAVLGSSFGAIPEIIGEGGWLVDPRRIDNVVEAITTILRQSGVRQELQSRALLRARSFSWEKAAKETVKVYEELSETCA